MRAHRSAYPADVPGFSRTGPVCPRPRALAIANRDIRRVVLPRHRRRYMLDVPARRVLALFTRNTRAARHEDRCSAPALCARPVSRLPLRYDWWRLIRRRFQWWRVSSCSNPVPV